MKLSRIVARIMVGVFFALVFAGLALYLTGRTSALDHIYLNTTNKWGLVAPLFLLMMFLILLVLCTATKYKQTDLNWLLTLNIAILLIYAVAMYIRIMPYLT